MEQTIKALKERKSKIIEELDQLKSCNLSLLHNFSSSSKLDGIPIFACRYCKLDCGTTGYRCNHFLWHYNTEKLIRVKDGFDINPEYEQKLKREIIVLNNEIIKLE